MNGQQTEDCVYTTWCLRSALPHTWQYSGVSGRAKAESTSVKKPVRRFAGSNDSATTRATSSVCSQRQRARSCSFHVTDHLRDRTPLTTFRVRRRRREVYSDHGRLSVYQCICLSVCLSLAAFPRYCTAPDVTWGNGTGCPVVLHYWADLQSVHGFRCYDNIAPNAKCQRVLVLTLCLVRLVVNLLYSEL